MISRSLQPASSLLRLGVVASRSYMKPISFDMPAFSLRRRDRYEFIPNNDRNITEKKMKIIRRKMFVYKNLKLDPSAFIQYRYNSEGELEFYKQEMKKDRLILSNPKELIKVYQILCKTHNIAYSELQKLGLPF